MNALESQTDEEILKQWDQTLDFEERDLLMYELQRRDLFPSSMTNAWEQETGAYPLKEDPNFIKKLLSKREFAESLQTTWNPSSDICDPTKEFETTPVQRFVSNLVNPRSPYRSVLLYHGVGVGKTCAAVQISEAWLDKFPQEKVIIITPPTIHEGFVKNIFDKEKIVLGKELDTPNQLNGCTGTKYFELSNTLYEKNIDKIQHLVSKVINRRYDFFGYISFANYIRKILLRGTIRGLSKEKEEQHQYDAIRREFSGKVIIIDEAHNLRDIVEEKRKEGEDKEESEENQGEETKEQEEKGGGKYLTPFLNLVLKHAEGIKLVLLTATPMYNSYKEIVHVLNLLLSADKKATIVGSDIFDAQGNILPTGKSILHKVASRYISFMRGENPVSFPIRLTPLNIPTLSKYPNLDPRGSIITETIETDYINHLPIVPVELTGVSLEASDILLQSLPPGEKGLSSIMIDKIVQAGNFVTPKWWTSTPSEPVDPLSDFIKQTTAGSYKNILHKTVVDGEVQYNPKQGMDAKWLAVGPLRSYSPKFENLVNRIATSEGIVFVYSRFVQMGAIIIAIVLEANGYTAFGRKKPLLKSGIQTPGGRKCAICPKRENEHITSEEKGHFIPAKYALITGDQAHSPNNDDIIKVSKSAENMDGKLIKVLVGSQITGEGVDFRFIREIHMMEGWFHLNRIEQVLGRGIRFCSHTLLPENKRNTTTYLYASVFPMGENTKETADLYSYRIAFRKGKLMGNVSRILKQSAIDCNLNHGANIIDDEKMVTQKDSQGNVRNSPIRDMPFTAICDWIETCSYECIPKIEVNLVQSDESTYDEYYTKWKLNTLKKRFQTIFSEQAFYSSEDIHTMFDDIPQNVKAELFRAVIDNKNFKVIHAGKEGYIHYCNTYFLFQPFVYDDTSIPLSIRSAMFPVKRDTYDPIKISQAIKVKERVETKEESEHIMEQLLEWWGNLKRWLSDDPIENEIPVPPNTGIRRGIIIVKEPSLRKSKETVYDNITNGIKLFLRKMAEAGVSNDITNKIITTFFWDKFLSSDEKLYLLGKITNEEEMFDMFEGSRVFGKRKVLRVVQEDGNISYACKQDDGTISKCERSIADSIAKDTNDPLKQKISEETTGNIYGFIVSKDGKNIFKTSNPPESGKPISMGRECATVSKVDIHIGEIIQLGSFLKRAGLNNLNLDERLKLPGPEKLSNALKTCTFFELILRYLDNIRLNNKSWFYRPLRSYYIGHKGRTTKK